MQSYTAEVARGLVRKPLFASIYRKTAVRRDAVPAAQALGILSAGEVPPDPPPIGAQRGS
ncbi:hypothetical protein ABT369_54105 [Dactylosporangium sp. NPDC000244]|uniref:hypothetical protein n=1 Tax=Dactylosporangium sp. NPDC000244 TaxID=3154365 RepID=UPI00332B8E8C